ncbi:hypothetical protein [Amphritea pacifica]|uniref:Uncharacterized protein n=1 Tax=Amphritea pacifica TaxID=2811233 RepID=A0ABS2WC95_9GAMM|nr:hypothetical protein [Amphritea pacifica]MBN0989339.1 hypothetical protein [Amphritea pacifica]
MEGSRCKPASGDIKEDCIEQHQIATIRQQVLTSHINPLPDWAAELLTDLV